MADILNSIADALFDSDISKIQDLCIIPEPKPELGSENERAAFRREGNCIGIASWALPDLYGEAKRLLASPGADLRMATAMLVVNPEHMRAWSIRKEHLSQTTIASELAFSALILLRSPKSGEAWSHRAWVLRHVQWTSEIVETELKIALTAATKARSNYYAGVHRRRVLEHADESTFLKEIEKNRTWLQIHVGDSSGWWYHNALLAKLVACENFNLIEETAFIRDMKLRYGDKYQSVKQQHIWWEKQMERR